MGGLCPVISSQHRCPHSRKYRNQKIKNSDILELSKSLLLFTVDTISPKRIVKTCTVETSASLLEAYDAFAFGTRVIYDSLAIDPRRLVATTECPEIRNAMSADLTTTILSPHTKQLCLNLTPQTASPYRTRPRFLL